MNRRQRRARQHRQDWLRGYRVGIADMGFGLFGERIDFDNPTVWLAWDVGSRWAFDLSVRKPRA